MQTAELLINSRKSTVFCNTRRALLWFSIIDNRPVDGIKIFYSFCLYCDVLMIKLLAFNRVNILETVGRWAVSIVFFRFFLYNIFSLFGFGLLFDFWSYETLSSATNCSRTDGPFLNFKSNTLINKKKIAPKANTKVY